MFKRVRLNVRKQSQGRQFPWESTSLEADLYFNDGVKYTIKPEELERIAGEARAREQQRLAQEARARDQQRPPLEDQALEQAKERERLLAEGQAREQARLAEAARLQEAVRVAALIKATEQKMSREQGRELASKEEKAAWDLIRTSTNADDFYAFLQRFPSSVSWLKWPSTGLTSLPSQKSRLRWAKVRTPVWATPEPA